MRRLTEGRRLIKVEVKLTNSWALTITLVTSNSCKNSTVIELQMK